MPRSFATHDPALVSYLLMRGADPNLGPGSSVGEPLRLHLIPKSGSILRAAARQGSVESLNQLLGHGGELANIKLMHAATAGGHVSMMARVLELGADIDEGDDIRKTGFPAYGTPLFRAIISRKTEVVKFLLEKGASVTKPRYDELTTLDVVRMKCCGGCIPCRVHGNEIPPEIRELVKIAVEIKASGND